MTRPRVFPLAALTVASLSMVSACAANPGPPPIVEEDTTTATSTTTVRPAATRSQAQVGVQPLRNGLNPHLAADENSTVRDIAELTLPSPFIDGELNEDLLVSADVVPTVTAAVEAEGEQVTPHATPAMVVRYVINPAAQWSDGSPLTGADFAYLWRGMISTPGTVDPASYRMISDVRVSGGSGKTVDVVFSQPVKEWKQLFNYLLPSHLLDSNAADFATALEATIPASAGRYMVAQIDRGSGMIKLNRNDRFWGEGPASIDILTLHPVRSTEHIADRLRSGQIVYADHVPGETSFDTYSLIPGTDVRTEDGPRQLGLTMNVDSPLLGDIASRKELRGLIDVPLIARIAAGRSKDLGAAAETPALAGEPLSLKHATNTQRPLRIAADPRDEESMPAARALVDILLRQGIKAEAVAADMTDTASRLPKGEIDAVISWSMAPETSGSSLLASKILCPPADQTAETAKQDAEQDSHGTPDPSDKDEASTDQAKAPQGAQDEGTQGEANAPAAGEEPEVPEDTKERGFVSGNLSGLCTPATDRLAAGILSGDIPVEEARQRVEAALEFEAVWVPLLSEKRVVVKASGVTSKGDWKEGIAGAGAWKLTEEQSHESSNESERLEEEDGNDNE